MKKLNKNFIYGGLLGILLSGCEEERIILPDKPPVVKPPVETVTPLYNNSKILSEIQLNKIDSISSSKIYFSTPQDFSKGQILVGGVSDKTPEGILMKISNISPDKKVVNVEKTNLENLIQKGEIKFTNNLKNNEQKKSTLMKAPKKEFYFPINNLIIEDLDGDLNTNNDQLAINGYLSFDLDYSLDLNFNKGITNLEFSSNVIQESVINIRGSLEKEIDKEISLAEIDFKPITIPTSYGFPLVLIPKLDLDLNVVGNVELKNELEVKEDFLFEGKLFYQNKNWNYEKGFTKNFNFEIPNFENKGKIKTSISPELTIFIYGAIGPKVGAEAFVSLDVDLLRNPWWEIYGGGRFFLGINSGIFSSNIPNYEKNLIDHSQIIAKAEGGLFEDNLAPEADFFISPENGTIKTNFKFDSSNTKDDKENNSNLFYRWDFEGDGLFDSDWKKGNTLENHIYNSPGEYFPTLEVKDSFGKIGTKNKKLIVEDDSSIKYSNFKDPKDGQNYKIIKINNQWWFLENYNYYTKDSKYPNRDSINNHTYGRLYNFEDAKNICPAGWRIPDLNDWNKLIYFLDHTFKSSEVSSGERIGNILKEKGDLHWNLPNTGEDLIGFSLRGSGKDYLTSPDCFREKAFFWTTEIDNQYFRDKDSKFAVSFRNDASYVTIFPELTKYLLSVRYVKD